MIANFYDIESLENVWTLCNFRPEDDLVDVYILCDDPELTKGADFPKLVLQRVHEANKNFTGSVRLFDLHSREGNFHMARKFGLSNSSMVNDPTRKDDYYDFDPTFRLVCDTDTVEGGCPQDYDRETFPYFMGYNSYNYDTTMLAYYFSQVFPIVAPRATDRFSPVSDPHVAYRPEGLTASGLREFNDSMFLPQFKDNMPSRLLYTQQMSRRTDGSSGPIKYVGPKYDGLANLIRKNMMYSGRHVDVARLNEKSVKVGLKRILGMLGAQILESDKLKQGQNVIENQDQLLDLIAYNVSDCVNLKYHVFDNRSYKGQFDLKLGLLTSYPELIYSQLPDKYAPDIDPRAVRRDRLYIDSSSAQLATKSLCPYGHLKDIPAVSFMYPAQRIVDEAAKKGIVIKRRDVLEESREFFESEFGDRPEILEEFMRVYRYYDNIRGKNFNESKNYLEDYPNDGKSGYLPPHNLSRMPKENLCMFYYNADGTPSTGFVTFSTGGIHGAEYNRWQFDADMETYLYEQHILDEAKRLYPDPRDAKAAKKITLTDMHGDEITVNASKVLKTGSTKNNAAYRDKPTMKMPVLFPEDSEGGFKLNAAYTFTSADPTNHEDFTSYYPNMLRQMAAFWNDGLGYDRYAEIFQQKQDFGVYMKDKARPQEERDLYAVKREGTKLVLNSASGAADATFESNIRMNNQIISMRIIGQLFSWRIGQAQTFAGAKITSTNTDGLFSVMESELNDEILAREAADIGVEIEPEPTFLISKDTNNRLEMETDKGANGAIQAASGGTLGCRRGPNPGKSLAHPAIIDWALAEYLVKAAHKAKPHLGLDLPFDPETGLEILLSARQVFDKRKFLNMYQNVIASSIGSVSYIFAFTHDNPEKPIIMQHYNRVFIMKDHAPGTVHIRKAVSRKINAQTLAARKKDGNVRLQQHDDLAKDILEKNGVNVLAIPSTNEAAISKVTNIEDDWFLLIENGDLDYLPDDEVDFIAENLDYGKYLGLLGACFEKNWRNKLPNRPPMLKPPELWKQVMEYMSQFDPSTIPPMNPDRGKPVVKTGDPALASASWSTSGIDAPQRTVQTTQKMADIPVVEPPKPFDYMASIRSAAPQPEPPAQPAAPVQPAPQQPDPAPAPAQPQQPPEPEPEQPPVDKPVDKVENPNGPAQTAQNRMVDPYMALLARGQANKVAERPSVTMMPQVTDAPDIPGAPDTEIPRNPQEMLRPADSAARHQELREITDLLQQANAKITTYLGTSSLSRTATSYINAILQLLPTPD